MIEASINHEKGYVQSKEMIDIYSTREPQLAFHQRISFCLDIHNMSVKVSTAQLCEDPGGGLGGHRDGAEGGSGSAQAAVELLRVKGQQSRSTSQLTASPLPWLSRP